MSSNNESIKKKLLFLALPMALEGLLTAGADLVDTVMISSMGETSVSAVGLGTQIFFIHNMMIYGFCGGASTFMTQFYGKGDHKGIKKTLGISISGIFIISVFLFILVMAFPGKVMNLFTDIDQVINTGIPYIRYRCISLLIYAVLLPLIMALKSMQNVKLPVIAGSLSIGINVFLNYVLIYGEFGFKALGASGAAIATVAAMMFQLIFIVAVMIAEKHVLISNLKDYCSFDKKLAEMLLKNSIPTTLNETLWSTGMSAYNGIYGRISVLASAATQAADIITHVFTKTLFCVGDAALILVGEQIGQEKEEDAYKTAKQILLINVLLGVCAGGILLLLAKPITMLFNFEEECALYLRIILSIYAVFMPLKIFNVTLITGVLRAGGDVTFAMGAELSVIWIVALPTIYIMALIFNLPVYMVVLSAQIEDVVKSIILLKRFNSKKWINNKVKNL